MAESKEHIEESLKKGTAKEELNERLIVAAASGNLKELEEVLTQGADPNFSIESNANAFCLAVAKGHLPIVEYFIKNELANLKHKLERGYTPFLLAVKANQLTIVQTFLKTDPTLINNKTDSGKTALLVSAAYDDNHDDMIKFLLQHPEVNLLETDNKGYTALALAYKYERFCTIKLLENGAYIDTITNKGESIEDIAVTHTGGFSVERDPTLKEAEDLFNFAEKFTSDPTDAEFLKSFEPRYRVIGMRRLKDGNTVLHLALMHNKEELCAKLIMGGARLDIPNHDKNTALDLIKASHNEYIKACTLFKEIEKNVSLLQKYQYKKEEIESKEAKNHKEILELESQIKDLSLMLLSSAEEAINKIQRLGKVDKTKTLKQLFGFMLADIKLPIFNPKIAYQFISESGAINVSETFEEASQLLLNCLLADTSLPEENISDISLDTPDKSFETKQSREKLDGRLRLMLQYALDAKEEFPFGNIFHQYVIGEKGSLEGIKGIKGKDTASFLALADRCKEELLRKEAELRFVEKELEKATKEKAGTEKSGKEKATIEKNKHRRKSF